MARHDEKSKDQSSASSSSTPTPAAAPATAAVATDDRYVLVTTDGQNGTTAGAQVKRIDLIRTLWGAGMSRGNIAKYLTALSGKKVPYQIVFSATKGLAGGPPKQAAPAQATA